VRSDPSVREVGTIEDLDPSDWDALVPDNALCSHGWLRTVEETCDVALQPAYLVIEEARCLRAATWCYLLPATRTVLTVDDLMFGRARGGANALGLTFLPAVTCRPIAGYEGHVLVHPAVDAASATFMRRALVNALEALASSEGTGLAFSCLTDREAGLLDLLAERGYRRTLQFPVSYLDVRWDSFSGYLEHVKSHSRRTAGSIRNEINRARKTEVIVERLRDPAPSETRLIDLASGHMRRTVGRPFPFRAGFFTSLARNLGERAHVYIALKEGDMTGFSLMLERGGVAHVVFIGLDPGRSKRDPTYFLLAYDRPIMDAIARGFSRIHFGEALYELKRRRGCSTFGTWCCYRASSPARHLLVGPWFAFHSLWMKMKLGRAR
jgi:predicted N-acyltransferase